MPRLTRADSQARTRDQLIGTARGLFLRDGYFATSLDRVADEAGYSKGAVYSNFRNKDQLCLAVLDAIRAERIGEIVELIAAGGTFESRLAAFETWAESVIGDEGWSSLEMEFGSQVRRSPELRAAYIQRGAAIQATMAQLIEGFAAEQHIELPMPAESLALALWSLGVGLGLQRAIDHDVPVRTLTDLLRVLVGAPLPPATPARRGRARS